MAEPVKATRRYHSPRRRQQAAATRREILDAAQRLFERQGYAATTMAAIAAEAGVALKTVYWRSRRRAASCAPSGTCCCRATRTTRPSPSGRWYREVLEEPDPERRLRLNARDARVVKVRIGGDPRGDPRAAPADADIAALWRPSSPTSTRTSA